MIRVLLILSCGLVCVTSADAGGYGFNLYHRQSFYAQPLQQTFYFVGQPVRAAAILEAEKRADPNYQLFLQFQSLIAANPQIVQQLATAATQQEQQQQAAQEQPQSQLAASCARCHGGAEPKGGLPLDGSRIISADELRSIKEHLANGTMPPKDSAEAKTFDANAAGAVLVEAIDLLSE